jgi:hypothetical protein
MKIRNWHIGRNDSKLCGIADGQIIAQFKAKLGLAGQNSLVLNAITEKGVKQWSTEQELNEMKGHLFGFIRSRFGREMLDAHKLAMAERLKIGGMTPGGSQTPR